MGIAAAAFEDAGASDQLAAEPPIEETRAKVADPLGEEIRAYRPRCPLVTIKIWRVCDAPRVSRPLTLRQQRNVGDSFDAPRRLSR